jgi:hypothetical protein
MHGDEVFEPGRFVEESVAYYGTDKTFLIPDRIPDEIPFNGITYFSQAGIRIFRIFPG